MSTSTKILRGISAVLIWFVLALVIWRFVPSDYLVFAAPAGVILAAAATFFILRTNSAVHGDQPDNIETNTVDYVSEDRGTETGLNHDAGTLTGKTTRPASNEKPDAIEVVARYYRMAALNQAKEQSMERSISPGFSQKEASMSPASAPANLSGKIAETAAMDGSENSSSNTGDSSPAETAIPVVNEESSLTQEEKNLIMNAVWYRCENPYCKYTHFLDVHHIISEADGGSNKLDNLIVLCPYCHELAHKGEIPVEKMIEWISKPEERFRFVPEWRY